MKTRIAILTCLLFAVLGTFASATNLSPTTWTTDGQPHACGGPQYAADGNSSTYSICTQVFGQSGGDGEIWAGFPAGNPDPPAPKLNITVGSNISNPDGEVQSKYSLDGGTTWTQVFLSGTTFSKTTYQITLSSSQDMTKVEVQGAAWGGNGLSGSSSLYVYEIWISE